MRIITGTLKGRPIKLAKQAETRPTADRTKESMFGIIDARRYFDNLTVLDLFSGSGNLAFESISRGARSAVVVEHNPNCIASIEQNAENFGISNQIMTIRADVMTYLQSPSTGYDLVFADPPYDLPELPELPAMIIENGWLSDDGWFILEHDARHDFADHPHVVFAKPYGRTVVTIFLSHPVAASEEDEQDG